MVDVVLLDMVFAEFDKGLVGVEINQRIKGKRVSADDVTAIEMGQPVFKEWKISANGWIRREEAVEAIVTKRRWDIVRKMLNDARFSASVENLSDKLLH